MAIHPSTLAWKIPRMEEPDRVQSMGSQRVGHDWVTSLHLMVFPVVMYGCESWTIKKAECRRIDAFELWCWRRLLRVPWTARRSNQSILKEISPGCSLEGLMLKLKLQYFGHLMQRADLFEKSLMLGKIEGRRRRGWQDEMVGWHHWLDWHGFGWTSGVGDGQGSLVCCGPWDREESDTTEQLNWTELMIWTYLVSNLICADCFRIQGPFLQMWFAFLPTT